MVDIFVTYPNKKEAQTIAGLVLKKRLAACVNFFPIESWYHWQGKVVKGKEYVTLIKTQRKHFSVIETLIKKHHSYTVPCIIELPVGRVSKKYLEWVKSVTK